MKVTQMYQATGTGALTLKALQEVLESAASELAPPDAVVTGYSGGADIQESLAAAFDVRRKGGDAMTAEAPDWRITVTWKATVGEPAKKPSPVPSAAP